MKKITTIFSIQICSVTVKPIKPQNGFFWKTVPQKGFWAWWHGYPASGWYNKSDYSMLQFYADEEELDRMNIFQENGSLYDKAEIIIRTADGRKHIEVFTDEKEFTDRVKEVEQLMSIRTNSFSFG